MEHGPVVTVLVLVCVLLLVCQGTSLLLRKQRPTHQTWTALLTFSIALVIALDLYLWRSGRLFSDINSGFLLTQGSSLGLRVLVVSYAAVAALVVQSNRAARDQGTASYWLAAKTLGVMIMGALTVQKVGADYLPDSVVYGYDLYSPWMLLFITSCVAEWLVLLVGLANRPSGSVTPLRSFIVSWICLCVAGVGAASANGASQLRPGCPEEWKHAFYGMLAVATILAYRTLLSSVVWPTRDQKDHPLRSARNTVTWFRPAAAAAFLLLLLAFCAIGASLDSEPQRLTFVALLSLGAAIATFSVRSRPRADESKGGSESRIIRFILAVALAVMVGLSVDLFYIKWIPELPNLLGAGVASIVLVEIASEGPLQAAGSFAQIVWGGSSLVRAALSSALHHLFELLSAPFRWLSKLSTVASLLARVLVGGFLLMIWHEWANQDHTVVHAFEVYGLDKADEHLGKHFAEMVVDGLNGITVDLDENMLVAAAASSTGAAPPPLRTAFVHAGDLEAQLNSDSIDLGPLGKIPLGVLLHPLQGPVRALLKVRSVGGTLAKDANGYRLFARTNSGDSWDDDTDPEPRELAIRLAFEVLSTQPRWVERGMSNHEPAFRAFLDGLETWRRFERVAGSRDDVRSRTETIDYFRSAVAADPSFAVAHYRLALALQADGQVAEAKEHLRSALALTPTFGSARDALARLLATDGPSYGRPLIVPPADEVSKEARDQHRDEARALWSAMLRAGEVGWSRRDRAASHLGLCSLAIDGETEPPEYFDGVFNCAAAATLFSAIGDDEIRVRDRSVLRATALNGRGVLIARVANLQCAAGVCKSADTLEASDVPGCSAAQYTLDGWTKSTRNASPLATALFRQAHLASPSDAVITCNLAESEQIAKNDKRMRALSHDPVQQAALCDDLLTVAIREGKSAFYRETLSACARAIAIDALNPALLNAYAYAFRVWRFHAPNGSADESDWSVYGVIAEQHARTAVRLARGRRVEPGARLCASREDAVDDKLAMYESTLAEVLLARGRPHEAVEWLTRANEAAPMHAAYNEIRRDLAEAVLCAHRKDHRRSGTPCAHTPAPAEATLELVRTLEATREDRPFASDYRQLDAEWLSSHCVDPSAGLDKPELLAVVTQVKAPRRVHCGARTLHVDAPPIAEARVHVWGRELDFLDHVKDKRGKALRLDAHTTHGQYFLQLLDEGGAPLGAPVTFDSSLASRPAHCREGDDELRATFALGSRRSDAEASARLSTTSSSVVSSLSRAEQRQPSAGPAAEPEKPL